MQNDEIDEININGYTFLTIEECTEGLRLLTHKDTAVTLEGKTLFIKDPPTVFTGNQQNGWGSIFGSNISCIGANSTVMIGNNMVIHSRNGSQVINGSNITISGGGKSTTKEECDTEHIIVCDYSHLHRVISNGSMVTKFEIPLDTRHASASLQGSGDLSFTKTQSFLKLELSLQGSGSLYVSASKIGNMLAQIQGSGDINMITSAIINNASVLLTGSGEADLGESTIERANLTLTGSGDINGFTIIDDAQIVLTGSGSIKGKASSKASIRDTKTGSGKMRVSRIQ